MTAHTLPHNNASMYIQKKRRKVDVLVLRFELFLWGSHKGMDCVNIFRMVGIYPITIKQISKAL